MARHAAPTPPRRALLRAGLTVTAAGAVLGLAGTAAQAAPASPLAVSDIDSPLPGAGTAAVNGLTGAVGYSLDPITKLKLNPLAHTGVDPLDNAVGTQVADFKPVSTASLTAPLTDGAALSDLPVVGGVTKLVTG
ncbi:hypothetical protein [Streptomyces sp. NPDC088725]|uniref:hypothetical protein n=1 Tax=Streptomyces sp. NPDC088725 TaxID=3365873 RepID=UPI0038177E5D